MYISIHAPRAGRDVTKQVGHRQGHISIHAPRAGRDTWFDGVTDQHYISIHAPRAGRDFQSLPCSAQTSYFNPRAPCGARRKCALLYRSGSAGISIHAPRAGRDCGSAAVIYS